jgi:hypothetical protein
MTAGLLLVCGGDSSVRGEVALTETPFCAFFVVATDRGFSFLRWTGGLLVFAEGDRVVGPLLTPGRQSVEVEGEGSITVEVEAVVPDLSGAQHAFHGRCPPDTSPPGRPRPLDCRFPISWNQLSSLSCRIFDGEPDPPHRKML